MIGNTVNCLPNKALRMPPPLNAAKNPNLLYDSVKGHTGGSDVYMIYTNK